MIIFHKIMIGFYSILGVTVLVFMLHAVYTKRKFSRFSWTIFILLFFDACINLTNSVLFINEDWGTCLVRFRILNALDQILMLNVSALLAFKYIKATR